MKAILHIFIGIMTTQGFCQDLISDNATLITSPTSKYTLINDFKGLDFDKKNSKVSFNFVHDDTPGTIEGLDFKINFNPNDIENALFEGTAEIKTIDTDNFLRDGHLMWEKFFYKKKYPTINFSSTQVVAFENNTFKVIGNLTIKGITKEIIITFSINDQKLIGKTTIHTSDFDVNIHDEREKNKLRIHFHFPFLN